MNWEKIKTNRSCYSSSELSHPVNMNKEDALVFDQEIQEILPKGAVKQFHPSHKQFLSTIFIVLEKNITHKHMLCKHSEGCK